jgi:PAS domain S-box-containing protein
METRKTSEEINTEISDSYKFLADAMPQIVWIASPDGKVEYHNKKFFDYTGAEKGEYISNSDNSYIHPEDLESVKEKWNNSIKTGDEYEMELRLKRSSDNVYRWHLSRALPRRNDYGEIVQWVGTSTDIDDQKAAEEKLKRANAEMESFSYSVSHDLRGPLRAIAGFVHVLKEEHTASFDTEALRLMDIISKNTNKMKHLIDDLLNFSRVSRKEVEKSEIDIKNIVQNVIESLKSENQIQEKTSIVINDLPFAESDESMIRQVFINLISNAAKFTRSKQNPYIEIGSYEEKDQYVFYVKDNGVGFDAQYINKLFGIFQRLHNIEEFEGTGIGLAIVKRVINRHGGYVWADGTEGEGAVFYFSLPLIKKTY